MENIGLHSESHCKPNGAVRSRERKKKKKQQHSVVHTQHKLRNWALLVLKLSS